MSLSSTVQPSPLTHLRFLWRCLVDLRQETLQLRPMAHELVIHTISFVQECIDVGHSLQGQCTVYSWLPTAAG